MHGSRAFVLFALVLLLACRAPLNVRAADTAAERLPVPNSAAQGKVVAAIRQQYRDEYAKRTAADDLALAQNFRQQAAASGSDPVKQYVFLREARELAVNAGDLDAAFSIIDETARLFTLDAADLKSSALANSMDRALIPKQELFDKYLKVIDEALDRGDLNLATQGDVLALAMGRTTRDKDMAARAKPYDLRVHAARREYTNILNAAKKLQITPEDPDASFTVGAYLCFVQRRWDEGLPLLVQCTDSTLKDLARKDVNGPINASDMAELADGWWDLPDSKQTPRKRARERAAYWYEKALPQLTGEKKDRAAARIAETKQEQANPPKTENPS